MVEKGSRVVCADPKCGFVIEKDKLGELLSAAMPEQDEKE